MNDVEKHLCFRPTVERQGSCPMKVSLTFNNANAGKQEQEEGEQETDFFVFLGGATHQ